MGATSADWQRLAASISGGLGRDAAALRAAASDASGLVGTPDAVLRPEGPEDLVRLVEWARTTLTPVVARGAGTSLDGESVPVRGGVVVDFSAWDRVLEIDPVDGFARVQPGVPNRALDRALRSHRLTYPPNPGSGAACTLGGNVATNASGPRSYRHGPTRAWVRSLALVDGRAQHWQVGGRWAKASIGPDLVGLLVGSEGTLGLFTEIGVRVAPRPERRTGVVIPVPLSIPLGRWVHEVLGSLGPAASALEYVDGTTATALEAVAGHDWSGDRGLLLGEIEGSEADEAAALDRLATLARAHDEEGAVAVYPDAERLWEIRGAAGPSLERLEGPGLREDVVVPIGRLDDLLRAIGMIAARNETTVRLFGHIGQGNLHPLFRVAPGSAAASCIGSELATVVGDLGGAISGEHGIGATKDRFAAAQWGPTGAATLRAVKAIFDPDGILNPGKTGLGPAPPPSASPSVAGAPRTPPA